MTKEEKIKNSIILLKTTLGGSMRGSEADGVVRVVIEMLKEIE